MINYLRWGRWAAAFLGGCCLESTGFPNMPQIPQPDTLGEGGSYDGLTSADRNPRPPDDRLRWTEEGFASLVSPSSFVEIFFSSPDKSLSSQTKPDEPCLLNETSDLGKASINNYVCELKTSVCSWKSWRWWIIWVHQYNVVIYIMVCELKSFILIYIEMREINK